MLSAKSVRWIVRIVLLASATALVIAGPLPAAAGRVAPGLSPLALLSSSLAQRAWFAEVRGSLRRCMFWQKMRTSRCLWI